MIAKQKSIHFYRNNVYSARLNTNWTNYQRHKNW
jgi:hypothetical protein